MKANFIHLQSVVVRGLTHLISISEVPGTEFAIRFIFTSLAIPNEMSEHYLGIVHNYFLPPASRVTLHRYFRSEFSEGNTEC